MSDNMNDDIKEIIESLEDEDSQKEIDVVRNRDPMIELRNEIIDFIIDRASTIKQEEQFRSTVKNALLTKIQNNEVSVSQLINLLKAVDSDIVDSVESILSLLKPGQRGEVSPIFVHQGNANDAIPEEFENLDSQQSEVLHKLGRLVQYWEQQEKYANDQE